MHVGKVFWTTSLPLSSFVMSKKTFGCVRNHTDYVYAREHNKHAVFPVQGANAISGAPDGIGSLPDNHGISRMTLVHLTPSVYGNTSSPAHIIHSNKGLTQAGKDLVASMNNAKIFVDLAHIRPEGFWDAVDVHDPNLPILVTHTGVQGSHPTGGIWMMTKSVPLPNLVA